MKHLQDWQRLLAQTRGEAATSLGNQMRARYGSLVESYAHITSRPLRAQLTGLVLPGLALYQILFEDRENDRIAALTETESLFQATLFKVERRFIPFLNVLPNPFPLLRPVLRYITKNNYLPGATEVVEDTPNCFAVNTYRCFILDTLTEAGAPELTPLFCKTDDWLAELLANVRWLRTGTLAHGADCCDFRWCQGANL